MPGLKPPEAQEPQEPPEFPDAELDARERELSLRRSLRLVTVAWMFGSAWMYITTGAVMTRYAKALHMGQFGFGLLAALPFAGALVQLPASYFVEKYGGRKRLFLIAGLAHRAAWILVASVPWIFPEAHWWWMLLVTMGMSTILANMMSPAWITWMADLVPGRLRGRYFSARGQYGRFVGVVTTMVTALVLDRAIGGDAHVLRKLISIALCVASVCGMFDIGMLKWVPAAQRRQRDPDVKFGELLKQPLRDRNFRLFLGFNATLTFGIGYVGQFIWLYLFDVVGMSNLQANTMLVALPLVMSMLSFPIWGRLVDRLGCKPVLVIAGVLIVHGGASWIFVTRESWWLGYLGSMSATAAWPGVELASLNMLLEMSGSRERGRLGSAYVAVNSLVVALAGVASGLFGGAVAEAMADWHGSFLGYPLTYHGVLLLLSAALRAAALLWLIKMVEPQAYTTRAALRFMTTNIYSNVQQAVFSPARGLVRLGRLTYKMIPRHAPDQDGDAPGGRAGSA